MKVKSHAGYSGCDHPTEIIRDKETLQIVKILNEWRESGAKHYIVETEKSTTFKLVYFLETGKWNCIETVSGRTD